MKQRVAVGACKCDRGIKAHSVQCLRLTVASSACPDLLAICPFWHAWCLRSGVAMKHLSFRVYQRALHRHSHWGPGHRVAVDIDPILTDLGQKPTERNRCELADSLMEFLNKENLGPLTAINTRGRLVIKFHS